MGCRLKNGGNRNDDVEMAWLLLMMAAVYSWTTLDSTKATDTSQIAGLDNRGPIKSGGYGPGAQFLYPPRNKCFPENSATKHTPYIDQPAQSAHEWTNNHEISSINPGWRMDRDPAPARPRKRTTLPKIPTRGIFCFPTRGIFFLRFSKYSNF